jgi:hypothetical protein
MPYILIKARVEDEDADFGDRTGLTPEAHERLTDPFQGLTALGLDDIEITRVED